MEDKVFQYLQKRIEAADNVKKSIWYTFPSQHEVLNITKDQCKLLLEQVDNFMMRYSSSWLTPEGELSYFLREKLKEFN